MMVIIYIYLFFIYLSRLFIYKHEMHSIQRLFDCRTVNWEGRGRKWSLSECPIPEFTWSNYEKPRKISTDVYDSRYVSRVFRIQAAVYVL